MRYLLVMGIALSWFGPGLVMANTPTNQAQAQPPTMPTMPSSGNLLAKRARDAFALGHRLYNAGDYAGALKAWQDSYRLGQRHSVLYHIARAYRGLGQYKEAWRVLLRYRDLATTKDERKQATKELYRLEVCTADVPTVKEVSIHASLPSLKSGEMRHRIEIRNPTTDELNVTDVRSPELEELGIEARYVGGRVVAPFSTLYGHVLFPAKDTRTLESVTITAALENGMRAPFSIQTSISPMPMLMPDVPDERHRHTTISLHGLYGAVWLADDMTAPTDHKPTSFVGVAVRLQRGLKPWLAVEGELDVLSARPVQFDDGATHSALMARLLAHGVLRSGLANVRWLRLGLGVQAAQHEVNRASDDFAVNVLLSMGAGYTRRLDNWTIGVDGTVIAPVSGDDREVALQAGLHVGYGANW